MGDRGGEGEEGNRDEDGDPNTRFSKVHLGNVSIGRPATAILSRR